MILVENLPRLRNIHRCPRRLRPRQHRQPLDVVARQRVIGGHRRHAREPVQLLQRFFLRLLRHPYRFNLLLQLFDVLLALVHFPEFLLDRLQLLAQIVVALRLLHLILHFGLDLVAQLLHFNFFRQMLVDPLEAQRHIRRLQQFLLVAGREEGQGRRDKVHQPARLVDIHGDRLQLVRQRRRGSHNLLELRHHIALQRFQRRILRGQHFRHRVHRCHHEWLDARKFAQPHPLRALGENEEALVRHLDDLVYRRQRSEGMQILGLGRIHARVALRHHHNALLLTQGVDELNRTFPSNRERQHRMRKQNRIPHRQNRQNAVRSPVSLPGVARLDNTDKIASHECPYIK